MFFVSMDWFEECEENCRGMKVIPFPDAFADEAVFLAHDIAYNMNTWEEYEKPHDVYVYHSDDGVFDEDDYVMCSYLSCDKFSKCGEQKFNGELPTF